jgi:hypothetical protein
MPDMQIFSYSAVPVQAIVCVETAFAEYPWVTVSSDYKMNRTMGKRLHT